MNDRYRRALLAETGLPVSSRRNAEQLVKMLGKPISIDLIFEDGAPRVIAIWTWPGRDLFAHTFKGFDWQVPQSPNWFAFDAFLSIVGADNTRVEQVVQSHRAVNKTTLSITRAGRDWFSTMAPAVVYEKPPGA